VGNEEIIASLEQEVFPVQDDLLFNNGYCFFVISGNKKAKCVSCGMELSIAHEDALDATYIKCKNQLTQGELRRKLLNELPNIYILYGRFARACVNHIKNGAKLRSNNEIENIFNLHCKHCIPFYNASTGRCLKCGCNVNNKSGYSALNKIAWESEHCPINKW